MKLRRPFDADSGQALGALLPGRVIVGLVAVSLAVTTATPRVSTAGEGGTTPTAASAGARDASPASGGNQEALQQHRQEIKRLVAQGAWRQALQILDVFLQGHPHDPWAVVYRSLCQQRLHARESFTTMAPEQLTAFQHSLAEEEQAHAKASAQAKVQERQLKAEQAKWDAEIKRIQDAMVREQKTRKHQEAREANARQQAAKAQQRQLTRRPSPMPVSAASAAVPPQPPGATPAQEPSRPPELPQKPGASPVVQGATPPSAVELAPITVETVVAEQPSKPPAKPPAPPVPIGAVQIVADQLSVLKERQVAMAEGDVHVMFTGGLLTCDKVTVFTDTKDVYAEGHVRLERGLEVFRGELAQYNIQTKKGRFLEGTAFTPPWYQHGRSTEHIAEGVVRVNPGYLTSCEFEPPHFRFQGRSATVFSADKIARGRNTALFVESLPIIYLPWVSVTDRQSPFFLIPGKKKPWGPFVLGGYRYELPTFFGLEGHQEGTVKLDWRRFFLWGMGLDHKFETTQLGTGLIKLYYDERNLTETNPKAKLPKGAALDRYRVLVRHKWAPLPNTTVLTDFQKFSDINFRKDFLFRDEFVDDSNPDSFISMVTSDPNYTLTFLAKKRVNRFQSVTEELPRLTFELKPQPIGDSHFFIESRTEAVNLNSKTAHSEDDTDVSRLDWFEQLSYAMNWFRPLELTPKAGIRQTYYNKAKASADGVVKEDVISGQFSMGADASLKLFRIFPITADVLGLNLHLLRHVITPTVTYTYNHPPTVPNDLLNFAAASTTTNQFTFGVENKLQTRRPDDAGKLHSVDLARLLISLPYTFRGNGNKQGGRLGNWSFDAEFFPWPWLRLETDWTVKALLPAGIDTRIPGFNLDLVMVGGKGSPQAQYAPPIAAPAYKPFQTGAQDFGIQLLPQGQWYLGLGHRYSSNDKTESVLEWNWQISNKWQIGTFNRFTWKQVVSGEKRFNNLREYQYTLTRDLHDWIGQFIYQVDREFGEELLFTLTLKAFPEMPLRIGDSYHQPKIGSQSSPFSPVAAK